MCYMEGQASQPLRTRPIFGDGWEDTYFVQFLTAEPAAVEVAQQQMPHIPHLGGPHLPGVARWGGCLERLQLRLSNRSSSRQTPTTMPGGATLESSGSEKQPLQATQPLTSLSGLKIFRTLHRLSSKDRLQVPHRQLQQLRLPQQTFRCQI